MKRILIPVLALALGVLAGCAPAHRGYGRDARYERHERARLHRELVNFARELERLTVHTYRLTERQAHHFDRTERNTLRRLERLAVAARSYRREVERSSADPFFTRRDFDRLARSFNDAAAHLRRLHAYPDVYRAFEQTHRYLRQLERFYGGGYGGGGYGHGGYDGD